MTSRTSSASPRFGCRHRSGSGSGWSASPAAACWRRGCSPGVRARERRARDREEGRAADSRVRVPRRRPRPVPRDVGGLRALAGPGSRQAPEGPSAPRAPRRRARSVALVRLGLVPRHRERGLLRPPGQCLPRRPAVVRRVLPLVPDRRARGESRGERPPARGDGHHVLQRARVRVAVLAMCRDRLSERERKVALALLLLYPYAWFLFGTGYADALFLCATLGAFVLLDGGHPVLAGVVGVAATAGRPTGAAVVIGLVAVALDRRN